MSEKLITKNRKALFNYELLEHFEAGLVLSGTEVKSLRSGRANLGDSYVVPRGEELFLVNCHISPYEPASRMNHEPLRSRKLLLQRAEINKILGRVRERGLALIPIRLYFKAGRAKVEIALAKGKKLFDKREDLRKKDHRREMERALKRKKRD
ncbi:MAG: SsrA-binding protein [Deltaproteobacteria bacterium RIFCSPLOWO2_02_FULL_50_16]|nr:MAG: SsrA-binding protein [Deltaproteobacteria bacterium GWA2_50_8]OGQ28566.1 MAG: SsrA-binding protein [Deltaproteobacteria bacterium RIFCSPHIGHO2_02_FULL_50_15]OGQ56005.1 MAG: SsrA-binding protein [Deltaproteobacteria bacterium RIFCSPLOWO2_02_FULL_50_16]